MLAPAQTYCEKWQTCLDQIKSRTTEEEFVKWFKPIVPLEFDGKTLRLCVPNMSYVYQIEKHYIPFLRPIISQLYGQEIRLHYAVPKNDAQSVPVSKEADTTAISQFSTQTNTANIKNPFVIPGLKKIVIDPQLNPNYTFATFIEGECNRLARSAGMAVAVDPGHTPFNPLYIYGNSGLGKTHIVQSIGHEVRQRHPELQVLYVSMNKFQAQFQTAYKNGEIPDFIHFYQMIDVLIIDDIQELTGKTGTQNAFFNIFNHLQLADEPQSRPCRATTSPMESTTAHGFGDQHFTLLHPLGGRNRPNTSKNTDDNHHGPTQTRTPAVKLLTGHRPTGRAAADVAPDGLPRHRHLMGHQESGNCIRLDKGVAPFPRQVYVTEEEAVILKKRHREHRRHEHLKQNLKRKLYSVYDNKTLADTVVRGKNSPNIRTLIEAIDEHRQVILHGYQSAHGGEVRDRRVEPFAFTTNYVQVWCYDPEAHACKLFKTSRIGSAELTEAPWEHEPTRRFRRLPHARRHAAAYELGLLDNLLCEEYPLAERDVRPLGRGRWLLDTEVAGFAGVRGGLLDDIRIVDSPELTTYIHNYIRANIS